MSYIEVKSELVIEKCNARLEEIYQSRRDAQEELIRDRMNSWFFPAKTRDQAIEQLKNQFASITDWDLACLKHCMTEQDCKDLLSLAKHADVVVVSSEHVYLLK